MTTPTFATHHDVLRQFQNEALSGIQAGRYHPFVYPYRALGVNLVILYLLAPPTKSRWVHLLRYPLFAFLVFHSIDGIVSSRSTYVTVAYGVGLLNSWAVLWSATLIIFNDARTKFQRIEEVSHPVRSLSPHGQGETSSQPLGNGSVPEQGRDAASLRRRQEKRREDGNINADGLARGHNESYIEDQAEDGQDAAYRYQSLPSTFLHRLDWVLDLVSSFRGPRWGHQVSNLTPPPSAIQHSMRNATSDPETHPELTFKPPTPFSYITRRQLLQRTLPELLINYLTLDILKTFTMTDPYFWSLGPSSPSPFTFPGPTRLLLSAAYTYAALQAIFLLAPLVFACLLGPKRIGAHAWPWLYTPYFGSPRAICKKGLAGAWGLWWQQLFRFGFQEAGEAIGRLLDGMSGDDDVSGRDSIEPEKRGWGKKTQKGMVMRVVVAFGLSGVLHACASHTAMGPTRPVTGSAMFFWVQPLGLMGQKVVCAWMAKKGWIDKLPWFVREAGNLGFVVAWFALTGPLIADDFARTGIWLFEPVPLSPIRGIRGHGWWRWGGTWVRWHTADRWWMSGLAF